MRYEYQLNVTRLNGEKYTVRYPVVVMPIADSTNMARTSICRCGRSLARDKSVVEQENELKALAGKQKEIKAKHWCESCAHKYGIPVDNYSLENSNAVKDRSVPKPVQGPVMLR